MDTYVTEMLMSNKDRDAKLFNHNQHFSHFNTVPLYTETNLKCCFLVIAIHKEEFEFSHKEGLALLEIGEIHKAYIKVDTQQVKEIEMKCFKGKR